MTVCIATLCDQQGREGCIAICCDAKIGSVLGSAETMLKAPRLKNSWHALVSGTESKILSLVEAFKRAFHTVQEIDHSNLDEIIKKSLNLRRRELAEEFSQSQFAIPYDELLTHGKERLPPEIFYDAIQRVRGQSLEAELIVCGYADGWPEIYHCDSVGVSHPKNVFATIGEGEYLAASVLLRRQQSNITPLATTLYNVWEAKKYAEAVGSVGKSTLLAILFPDKGLRLVSTVVRNRLDELYKEYGPKDIRDAPEIGGPIFYDEELQLKLTGRA